MRVLLTGGAGFIGSHIALLLLQRGYDVIILDSFVNSSPNVINAIKSYLDSNSFNYNLNTIKGDIRDKRILNEVFINSVNEGNPIKAVIHLAGWKSVYEAFTNPLHYWDVNVCGAYNLLSTMMEFQCFSIVFSSSATIYGLSDTNPIS